MASCASHRAPTLLPPWTADAPGEVVVGSDGDEASGDLPERRSGRNVERRAESLRHAPRPTEEALHLPAARDAMSAPGAKVLAVVAQQAVAVLGQAGLRTLGNFDGRVGRGGFDLDRYSVPRGELLKRYLGDGAAAEATGQAHVMHDLAAADVDAVVGVSATRSDEMRSNGDVALLQAADSSHVHRTHRPEGVVLRFLGDPSGCLGLQAFGGEVAGAAGRGVHVNAPSIMQLSCRKDRTRTLDCRRSLGVARRISWR